MLRIFLILLPGQMNLPIRKTLFFAFIVFLELFAILFISLKNIPQSIINNDATLPRHSVGIRDLEFYKQAYDLSSKYTVSASEIKNVSGGIVPHHMLAAPLVTGFFNGIAGQDVEKVILIGPNHFGIGIEPFATSGGVFNSVFGDTYAFAYVKINEKIFDHEHSISSIVPFITKTFPKAKVLPIVVRSNTTKEQAGTLVQKLLTLIDEKTLVLASVDFSHYQTSDNADKYDQESISTIKSFDLEKVLALDPVKNVDSPISVYVLMKLMEAGNAKNIQVIANTNSAKLLNNLDVKETTSYFTVYFSE